MINKDYVQLFLDCYSRNRLIIDRIRISASKAIITGDYEQFIDLCGRMRIADMQKELHISGYYTQLAIAAIVAANQIQQAQ